MIAPRRLKMTMIPVAWTPGTSGPVRASIVVAIITIVLKTLAWWITGSVGLLSDAAESVVNLVAALVGGVPRYERPTR